MEVLSPENYYWYSLTLYMEADSQWVNFVTIPRDEDNNYKDKLADYWEALMLADPRAIRGAPQCAPSFQPSNFRTFRL
jgi:hypothetical protein